MGGADEASTARAFLAFLNESWTPFHAVEAARRMLDAAGFEMIRENDAWRGNLRPGGRYYYTRNQTSLVAFAVGAQFQQSDRSGFTVVGAHTDSPCPKLKPVSKLKKSGYLQLSVVGYGGGLWHTWFDRDLSVAGRVLVRDGSNVDSKLIRIDRPILRIPTLAIHLSSDEERGGFGPNLQSHLPPVMATEIKARLLEEATKGAEGAAASPVAQCHHPLLLDLLAQELKVQPKDIEDFELQICDTQPGVIGGALGEFIFSGRLDNLCSSYQSLIALMDSTPDEKALENERNVRLIVLFDHEEIGSVSAQGATSTLLPEAMTRITEAITSKSFDSDAHAKVLRNSYVVSADMAHALHPNYESRHDPALSPKFHGGLVIKHNVNQKYATNSITAQVFRELGRRAGVPIQEFAVKADSRCGSTIGSLLAGLTGVKTVDVGSPQWSMHSIREVMATADVLHGIKLFKTLFEQLPCVMDESWDTIQS